jgi:hypothetical protein
MDWGRDARLGLRADGVQPDDEPVASVPDSPARNGIVVWTGRELIGWGGGCCGDVSDDGSANPATNAWRKLAPAPVSGQQSPIGAWTGASSSSSTAMVPRARA